MHAPCLPPLQASATQHLATSARNTSSIHPGIPKSCCCREFGSIIANKIRQLGQFDCFCVSILLLLFILLSLRVQGYESLGYPCFQGVHHTHRLRRCWTSTFTLAPWSFIHGSCSFLQLGCPRYSSVLLGHCSFQPGHRVRVLDLAQQSS